ncbi:MAG: hypothetical protein A2705_05200 [Omnitrophica WOR_2 bacterium RIFCSPHIGHO2_01_FULL_52_10]|nr:MAG: hypothetical protein A2705_05200 [Omnitrophica WOR_2 bacterium RIFCSPHIGHO2_01_FULL_52_10]
MGLAKTFIMLGIAFILIGGMLSFAGRIPWLGRLPGDIVIKKENLSFYFPLTTCLLLSALLSFVLFLWRQR